MMQAEFTESSSQDVRPLMAGQGRIWYPAATKSLDSRRLISMHTALTVGQGRTVYGPEQPKGATNFGL